MEKIVTFQTRLMFLLCVYSHLIVNRAFTFIVQIRTIKNIWIVLRFIEAEKKKLPSPQNENQGAFYTVPISTLGESRMEDLECGKGDISNSLKKFSDTQNYSPNSETIVQAQGSTMLEDNESSSQSREMSSAEVLRNSMTPLGMNNSLNIQRNENNSGSLTSGISSFMQNSNSDHVPLDRPLYINTAMTAQQRIDIYRRLSGPPQDDEPALLFRWS